MFCNKCGKEIPNDSKVCKYCGASVNNSQSQTININANTNVQAKKKIYQKWWFWLIIVLVILFVIVVASGTSDNNVDSGDAKNTSNVSDTNPKSEYNVGDTFSNKSVKLKYISLDKNFKGYSTYATVKSGHKIIKAEFEFENISTTDKYLSYGDFNCYADGYVCDAFYSVDDAGLSGSFIGSISAGKKAKGNVYFEVPSDAKEITIEYDANIWTSEKVVFRVK